MKTYLGHVTKIDGGYIVTLGNISDVNEFLNIMYGGMTNRYSFKDKDGKIVLLGNSLIEEVKLDGIIKFVRSGIF